MRRGLFLASGVCVAGSGVAFLTGCSGGAAGRLPSVMQPTLDEMLYKVDVYAALEGSTYTVRSDMQNKTWLKRPSYDETAQSVIKRPMVLAGSGCNFDTGCVEVSVSGIGGAYISVFATPVGNGGGGVGAIWQLPSKYWECFGAMAVGLNASLKDIAGQILKSPSAYGLVASSAAGFLQGYLSLEAFSAALLVLPVTDLVALAWGAGIAIGALLYGLHACG